MKFKELSSSAKLKAISDYITEWEQTHPNENLTTKEACLLCKDIDDDVDYNLNGEVQE